MAFNAVPLGAPAITPPVTLDLNPIRAAISAARQRIEKIEKVVSTVQASQVDELTAQINALRTQLSTLAQRVALLEGATRAPAAATVAVEDDAPFGTPAGRTALLEQRIEAIKEAPFARQT